MPDEGTGGGNPILGRVFYEFRCEDGTSATWQVYRMRMIEEVNAPYQLELDIVTQETDTDTSELLGGAAEFLIGRNDRYRTIYGIIADLEYIGVWLDSLLVRVRIVPAFTLLRQRVTSRIFQDQSVQDIVQAVLDEAFADYSRSVDMSNLTRGTTPRDYCVQYHESDFDFVCRLLEEEGISYHFVQDEDQGHEVLVLTDDNSQLQDIENVDGSRLVPIRAVEAGETEPVESLRSLDYRRSLSPTSVMRQDYHFTTPMFPLFVPVDGADDRGRNRRVYHHMRRRFDIDNDDMQTRATDHLESARMMHQIARGTGNVITFRGGSVFELDRHDLPELEVPWVLTRVEHVGSTPEVALFGHGQGSDSDADPQSEMPAYENRFECVPLETPVRPRQLTPKPKVYGPQTAIVVGASGDEICVDEHGRIRVQFHWEEDGAYDDTSSCWVRVAQSWAGPGWGFQFIPRVNMEVVVTFLEGNPDRPLVTGCVYNGDNPPPYSLPDNKTQSGIKTDSSIGEGSNELRFEDAAGAEEIYLHGQKDWTIAIDNDKNQTVGNNETLSVGNDRTKTVGNNQSEDVGANKEIHVGGNHTEAVDGNQDQLVGRNQTLTVRGDQTIDVTGSGAETIGGDWSQTIGSTSKVNVALKSDEVVGGVKGVTVGGMYSEKVGASRSITAVGAFSVTAGLSAKIKCAKSVGIKAQDNFDVEADKDVNLKSKKKTTVDAEDDLTIKGKKKALMDVKDEITLKCGKATIQLKKNGDIILNGKKITVKGSGDVILKGKKVQAN